MVEERRDTVVVDRDNSRSPLGWIIGLVVVIILVALFFTYGGFGLFSGGGTQGTNTLNVDTPDTVNVQPNGQ